MWVADSTKVLSANFVQHGRVECVGGRFHESFICEFCATWESRSCGWQIPRKFYLQILCNMGE